MAERMAQNSERIAQNSEQIRASNEATNERFAIVHAEIEKMTSGIYALAVKMDERLRALEKRAT